MKSFARRALVYGLPPVITFLVLVAAWELAVRFWQLPPYLLPAPSRVLAAMDSHQVELLRATALTAAGALCGFALSLVVGTLIAFAFSQSAVVQRSFYPYAIFLQTVPIVAVAPLIISWCGHGFQSVVVVSLILGLFPIITNVTAGLTRLDPNLLDLFELYNASWRDVLTKLRIPSAVPFFVAGAKTSCGLSVIGAIVGEVFAGVGTEWSGLGHLIMLTSEQLKTDYAIAAVFCSTLLGVTIFGAVSLASATVLRRWHGPAGAAT